MANKAKTWETNNRVYTRNSKGVVTYKVKNKTVERVASVPIAEAANTQETPADTIKRLDKRIRELSNQTLDIPHEWPTTNEVNNLIYAIEARAYNALLSTKKEGTRQDLELARHHLKIAKRYFIKALTI